MPEFGKMIFALGLVLAALGLFFWKFAGKIPLGKLPGDLAIQRPNFSFYFPLTTCLLLSVVLTLLLWLFRR